MWCRHKGKATEALEPRRPTDETLRDALRMNDDHVRGLTRLDQELVYVPLTGLAAAIIAAATADKVPNLEVDFSVALLFAFFAVGGLVARGLRRNQERHVQLLCYRKCLADKLGLPAQPERRDLVEGRRIYFALFVIGWTLGAFALLSLLTSQ